MGTVETPQTTLSLYEEGEYLPVSEQPIAVEIAGPIKFSVMEEFLSQRYENNLAQRGPAANDSAFETSLKSSNYERSTVASAGISLPF